jgi:hypothetical protein
VNFAEEIAGIQRQFSSVSSSCKISNGILQKKKPAFAGEYGGRFTHIRGRN